MLVTVKGTYLSHMNTNVTLRRSEARVIYNEGIFISFYRGFFGLGPTEIASQGSREGLRCCYCSVQTTPA